MKRIPKEEVIKQMKRIPKEEAIKQMKERLRKIFLTFSTEEINLLKIHFHVLETMWEIMIDNCQVTASIDVIYAPLLLENNNRLKKWLLTELPEEHVEDILNRLTTLAEQDVPEEVLAKIKLFNMLGDN